MAEGDRMGEIREQLGCGLSDLGSYVNDGDLIGFNEIAVKYDALLDEAKSLGIVVTSYRQDFDLYTGAIEGGVLR